MSNITIAGNVGREPETRYTPDGKMVLQFSVALYTGGTKEKGYNDPVWVSVAAFETLAESWKDKLAKGAKVTITGQPRSPRTYKKDGQDKSAGLEVTAYKIELGDAFREPEVEY